MGTRAVERGIVTSDYAMQACCCTAGFAAHTGDRVVRSLRQWKLRCSACFAITDDMTRVFCARCGSNSMEKIAVSNGEDGECGCTFAALVATARAARSCAAAQREEAGARRRDGRVEA